jgi:dCMP deaminase
MRQSLWYQCESCPEKYQLRTDMLTRDGKRLCDSCKKKRYRLKHGDKSNSYHKLPHYKEKNRAWRLKRYYNLTPQDYDQILQLQDGVCAICRITKHGDGGKKLVVDHDHSNNQIRGLLCDNCNRAIGALRDNPKILQTASIYLLRSSSHDSWERYFLNLAAVVASKSKDISVQVGAVLVKDKTIIGTGYNGFPRGCDDKKLARMQRPDKYAWTVHAEENALLHAARYGFSSSSSTLYVTPMYPCSKCTRAMIQAGVKRVVAETVVMKPTWIKEFEISKQMMKEAGIEFVEIN